MNGAREIRQGLFMVMEICWLVGPLLLLDAALPPAARPAIAAVSLLYPAAYLSGRIVRCFDWSLRTRFLISVALFLLALSGAIVAAGATGDAPRKMVMAAIGGLAWIRGGLLARRDASHAKFAGSFEFGLVVLLPAMAVAPFIPMTADVLFQVTVVFIVLGLIGLWQARATAPGTRAQTDTRARGLGLAVVGLGIVLMVGLALWAAVDRSALEILLAVATGLMRQIGRAFHALVAMLPDRDLLDEGVQATVPSRPEKAPSPDRKPNVVLMSVLFYVMTAMVAGLCLWQTGSFLVRWLRRPRRTMDIRSRRSPETSWETLRRLLLQVRDVLSRAAAFLRRTTEKLVWRRLADSSVRDLYRRLRRRLALKGWRRRPNETAEEYRRRLAAGWPGDTADLDRLTAAFVADRYGPSPVAPEASRRAWPRLLKDTKRMRYPDGR